MVVDSLAGDRGGRRDVVEAGGDVTLPREDLERGFHDRLAFGQPASAQRDGAGTRCVDGHGPTLPSWTQASRKLGNTVQEAMQMRLTVAPFVAPAKEWEN